MGEIDGVNIWLEEESPKSLLYWHKDEFEEDGESALAMATAIQLYYTNPQELLDLYSIV